MHPLNKCLHILVIAPQPFYEDRGTPIVIFEELKILSQLGFRVDVATFPIGADVNIPGVKLVRSKNMFRFKSVAVGLSLRKVLLDLFLSLTIFQLMRRKHYDCIHAIEEGSLIAFVCKYFFKIPVIYDMHSSLPEQLRKVRFFRKGLGRKAAIHFEKILVKNADAVLTSAGLGKHVLSIDMNKPIWECYFSGVCSERRNEDLSRKLKIFGRPTVVYSGTFSDYQGLDLLLEAAAILRKKKAGVLFVLVGGTEFEITKLATFVEKRKLNKTVQLHARVSRFEIADYLSIANVLVLPRREGMNAPLKLFEYMNSKKPIVATDIPAHTALLNNKSAILVNPESEALAEGLLRVIEDKELSCTLASEACRAVQSLEEKSLLNTLSDSYRFITIKFK